MQYKLDDNSIRKYQLNKKTACINCEYKGLYRNS